MTNEGAYRAYMLTEFLRSTGEREFPMQLASALFFVMSHDGCRQEDLIKATGMSPSSVSRCVSWLGAQHRLEHRSGLRVVRRERDPDDPKRWRLYLTPKGKQWLNLFDNQLSMPLEKAKAEFVSLSENRIRTYDPANDPDLGPGV